MNFIGEVGEVKCCFSITSVSESNHLNSAPRRLSSLILIEFHVV